MASAYTSVQTSREGFASQAPSTDEERKVEWSADVREYVSRAFAEENAIQGIAREDMTVRLKQVIGGVAQQGLLHTTDWKTMPLPQFLLQQERNAVAWQNYYAHAQAQANQTMNQNMSTLSAKKRRHDDSDPSTVTPPWKRSHSGSHPTADTRTTNVKSLTDRVEKRSKKAFQQFEPSSKFQEELEQRRRRFEKDAPPSPPQAHNGNAWDDDMTTGPIIGTSQNWEKSYFRLTRPPVPSEVRPLSVLKEAFKMLRSKWREERKYTYICDQFKSLRQDLTVQRIKNSFTVEVYELHARIALEVGDLGEYNQCQTQLRSLYSLKLGGKPAEFLAYRILYFVLTANRTDMNRVLADVTKEDKESDCVKHALATRKAVALGNYHKLFRLYLDAPNMGPYLMDKFVDRERLLALVKMCST
jgi:hypothetical protein